MQIQRCQIAPLPSCHCSSIRQPTPDDIICQTVCLAVSYKLIWFACAEGCLLTVQYSRNPTDLVVCCRPQRSVLQGAICGTTVELFTELHRVKMKACMIGLQKDSVPEWEEQDHCLYRSAGEPCCKGSPQDFSSMNGRLGSMSAGTLKPPKAILSTECSQRDR